jgi:hypothetical protein
VAGGGDVGGGITGHFVIVKSADPKNLDAFVNSRSLIKQAKA